MKNERTHARDRAADELFNAFGSHLPLAGFASQTKEQEALGAAVLRLTDEHNNKVTAAMLRNIAEVARLTVKIVEADNE